MVILDPATEQALSKFDGVLADPALEIMFEEADVAALLDAMAGITRKLRIYHPGMASQ